MTPPPADVLHGWQLCLSLNKFGSLCKLCALTFGLRNVSLFHFLWLIPVEAKNDGFPEVLLNTTSCWPFQNADDEKGSDGKKKSSGFFHSFKERISKSGTYLGLSSFVGSS